MPTDPLTPDETVTRSPLVDDPEQTHALRKPRTPRVELTAGLGPTPTCDDRDGPADAPSLGQFGKYELLDAFPGGMGIVYRAYDTKLNRVVALKMLPLGPRLRPKDVDRFWREARTVASLTHKHIIPIHEFEEIEDRPYFTTDFIEGGNLTKHLDAFRGDSRKAVEFLAKVARAIDYAHKQNILHRDLKPGNILVSDAGEPLVSDFGLARLLDRDATETAEGSVLGTPAYMPPEQALGRLDEVGVRSDVWSLGVVLYELLGGERPFAGSHRDSVTPKVLHESPKPLRELVPGIEPALEAIVSRCLEKDAAKRYPSAAALANDLEAWLERRRVEAWEKVRQQHRRRRRRIAAIAVVALAVLSIPALFALRPSRNVVRIMQAELKRDGVVNLLDAEGKPRYSRLPANPAKVIEGSGGVCTLEAEGLCLLELIPDPGIDRYRLRAEFKSEAKGGSTFGVYGVRSEFASPNGPLHTYLRAALLPGNAPGKYLLRVDVAACAGNGGKGGATQGPDPQIVPALEWTELDLELTPDFYALRRGGVREWSGNRADLRVAYGYLSKSRADLNHFSPQFSPREGAGVFVHGGRVSMRNVRIEASGSE